MSDRVFFLSDDDFKNIPALIKINSSLSSCALFQQPSNGRVQFVSSSATPWQFCRDRRNATSAWSSYITALLKAILWSNQIEKYQLMVSAGEPPVLRSWPRPTKSRRHLTLKEREVLFLSQERDKWSAWMSDSWSTWKYFISHSNTPSLALSLVHNCLTSTLPPSPALPSDLSRTAISSESRDGTDLSELLPTRSWPETCPGIACTHTLLLLAPAAEETEPKLNNRCRSCSFPPAPQEAISTSRALLTQHCCSQWS